MGLYSEANFLKEYVQWKVWIVAVGG